MKILDIGCSIGIFLLTAQERGFETYGVDISELSAEYARKQFHLNVFSGTLEAAHYPDNTFDIITLWDVIEHVLEPGLLLAEAKRVLKCNGVGGLFQIIYSILHPCLYQDRSSRMDMKS
jgi:2-polyprenyl-3-methyl-5-hydroxy-6-metoxy-1,4-benzoquinol methylase